jgi:hypothetical protein
MASESLLSNIRYPASRAETAKYLSSLFVNSSITKPFGPIFSFEKILSTESWLKELSKSDAFVSTYRKMRELKSRKRRSADPPTFSDCFSPKALKGKVIAKEPESP